MARRVILIWYISYVPLHACACFPNIPTVDRKQPSAYVAGLAESTSPNHIIATLRKVVPEGSPVYIMTNEWDLTFFDPLKLFFKTYFWSDFQDMRDLMSGCPNPNSRKARSGTCDSIELYSIEQEFVHLVSPSQAIYTFRNDCHFKWRAKNRAPYSKAQTYNIALMVRNGAK